MSSTRRSKELIKPPPKAQIAELAILNHFRCPISLDLMMDPVIVSTGITYDRCSIEAWLEMGNSTCPVTNQELVPDDVIPNHSLRRLIQDWCVAHRSHGIERIPTPKVPITASQAQEILSEVSNNHFRANELVARVKSLTKESERNRRCFSTAGAARVLAALFSELASCNNSAFDGALDEILSTIICFLPLDHETCWHLGSRDSLKSIVSVLKFGGLGAKLNTVAVVRELLSTNKEIVRIATQTDGLIESLIELIRKPISPGTTKTSLAASYFLISASEKSATRYVELGLVPLVLELLVDSDKAACEKALAVIDGICSYEKGREAGYGHALAVPVLVKKMFRVSGVATECAVSALWKLCKNCREEERRGVLFEATQVGAFQKVLLLLQVGCSGGAKEKATELLKIMNGSKEKFECIDVMDFKGLKRG